MRGRTLGQMVEDLRLEIGHSPNPAMGQNTRPALVAALQNAQEELYDDFDWPFLRVRRDIPTVAGERYYDFPDDVNLERVEKVEFRWGTEWTPVGRGIDMDHYTAHDSDEDERADPVERWDVIDTGGGEQMEIWPIPASNGSAAAERIRIIGIRKQSPFIGDADRCDLDHLLIVLFAAQKFLSGEKLRKMIARANARLMKMRGRSTNKRDRTFTFTPPEDRSVRRRPIRVAYVRNP